MRLALCFFAMLCSACATMSPTVTECAVYHVEVPDLTTRTGLRSEFIVACAPTRRGAVELIEEAVGEIVDIKDAIPCARVTCEEIRKRMMEDAETEE